MVLRVVPKCAGGPGGFPGAGGFPGGAPIGFSGPEEGREGSTNISFKTLVHLRPHHIMNVKIMTCFSDILQCNLFKLSFYFFNFINYQCFVYAFF